MNEYLGAARDAHRLVVIIAVVTWGLALFMGRVNYLTLISAELAQLELLERSSLTFGLEEHLTRELKGRLPRSSLAHIELSIDPDKLIQVEHVPNVSWEPGSFDDYGSISRVLAASEDSIGSGFKVATLAQMRRAMELWIYVPDLQSEEHIALLDRCITAGLAAGQASKFRLVVEITHEMPARDLEIPGKRTQLAKVFLSAKPQGRTLCFEMNEFGIVQSRDLLSWVQWRGAQWILPFFDLGYIPPYSLGFEPWGMLQDLTISEARAELRRQSSDSAQDLPGVEVSFPREALAALLPAASLVALLLLFSHVRESVRRLRRNTTALAEFAWVGLYPNWLSQGLVTLSITILPSVATHILWKTAYASSALSLASAGRFGFLVILFGLGVLIEFSLARLRMRPAEKNDAAR